jgi:hypothetical protein
MEKLNKNWLTEGMIDFEYKKYILLAYLKHIRQNFRVNKLYPFLSDLIDHYIYLKKLHKEKDELSGKFPKYLNMEELMASNLIYEKLIKDDELVRELSDIMIFAIEKMQNTVKSGKEIYDIVEENMEIIPIGLTSLYQKEGYLLINQEKNKEVNIYRYHITIFEGANDTYRAIHTTYIETVMKGISTTYEWVRSMLIRKDKDLANPATYLIHSKQTFPLEETVLPVAKRLLIRHVNVS